MRLSARSIRRLACAVTAAATLVGAPFAASADAELAAGIVGTTTLVTFDTATPTVLTARPISGLASATETVVGIDLRPATGQLVAVTVPLGIVANALVRTYVVDPVTGAATLVGSIPASTVSGAADTPSGVDVNPTVDRIRVAQANGENFRINPNNGTLAGDDVNLTFSGGATGPIVAAAYDRNVVAAVGSPTTLYEIDCGSNQLVVQGGIDGRGPGGANGGQVTPIGPLGVTLDAGSDAGFDVSGASGVAYATLRSGRVSGLYTVNLMTGAATLIGSFALDVRDVAILPTPEPPPPPAPPPPPPPAPNDTTGPTALLDIADSATFGRLLRSKLSFSFSCNEACAATATLRAGRATLAAGSGSLTSASAGTLKLTPTRAGRRYLSRRLHPRRKRVRATLSVTLADTAGNHTTLSRAIALRRR